MYSENLRNLRRELQISAQKMADKMGVSRGSISQYEAGLREPNYNFIQRLNAIYNVNLNWFVSGNGEMFNKQDNFNLSNSEEEKIKAYVSKILADKGII